ncbi:unnamed protein product [Mycena citricolor]|uniref:ADF-H domain-containing protein n=1 Tax=Mycena citricolor TaxID=2018698 RepID=A0AAD2HER0_9AGAR|nr:unnamed protein product [Mycena citricolor]
MCKWLRANTATSVCTPPFRFRSPQLKFLAPSSLSLSFHFFSMADVSDPAIDAAYQDVRSDKSDTNWVLLDYENDRSDKLVVTGTGTGGLAELRESLDDGKASYAYVRVSYSNDKESKREKFILVVWIGPSCKVMRKAKAGKLHPRNNRSDFARQISVHSADVKSTLRVFSIEVAAREKDDLNEEPIVVRLRKAGGASYDGV